MNMTTPADLLALIPTLINREPEDALVLVTLQDDHMQAALGLKHVEDMEDMADYVTAIEIGRASCRERVL